MTEHSQVLFPSMREREGLLDWADKRDRSAPFFAALHRVIADDDELFALSLEAQEGQFCGRMLLSAVHALLLRDPSSPLAAYFPSITRPPKPADEAAPLLKAFCRSHQDQLTAMLRSRTLQTTDPDRAIQVLFALDEVQAAIAEPFSLVEVGCSAGLLLLFDQYRYDFGDGVTFGADDAEVVVAKFKFVGERPPLPEAMPQVTRRVGLDLNPIDVADDVERRWILGCTVSDFVNQFDSIRTALDYRARIPLQTVAGDAMETLPKVLDTIAGPVCVLHSRCLYQWSSEAQEAFSTLLKSLSMSRTIHRIGIEGTGAESVSEITHTIYRNGEGQSRILGRVTDKDNIEWLV